MTAPNPLAFFSVFDQRGRLRIVNHHHVAFEVQALGIAPVGIEIGLSHRFRELLVLSLQRVDETPIDCQEFLIGCEHLPASDDSEAVQNRNQSAKDLRWSDAVANCADVHEVPATNRLAEPVQKIHRALWGDVSIFIQPLCHCSVPCGR